MRLHTSLTADDIHRALIRAKAAGHVTSDVGFDPIVAHNSRSHPRAYEVQLGASNGGNLPADYTNQYGKRQKTRCVRNAKDTTYRFSATWHEWGWFMSEIYRLDSSALWGAGPRSAVYGSESDFHFKTHGLFSERPNAGGPTVKKAGLDPIVFGY